MKIDLKKGLFPYFSIIFVCHQLVDIRVRILHPKFQPIPILHNIMYYQCSNDFYVTILSDTIINQTIGRSVQIIRSSASRFSCFLSVCDQINTNQNQNFQQIHYKKNLRIALQIPGAGSSTKNLGIGAGSSTKNLGIGARWILHKKSGNSTLNSRRQILSEKQVQLVRLVVISIVYNTDIIQSVLSTLVKWLAIIISIIFTDTLHTTITYYINKLVSLGLFTQAYMLVDRGSSHKGHIDIGSFINTSCYKSLHSVVFSLLQ